MVRVLAMLISLIRLLIVQNSEGIILSRLTQIDPSFVRSCFSLHDSTEDFTMKTKQNENTVLVYLSTYLVYMMKIAIESYIEVVSRITSDPCKASNIMRMTELYFMEMIFLAKSGRFEMPSLPFFVATAVTLLSCRSVFTFFCLSRRKIFTSNVFVQNKTRLLVDFRLILIDSYCKRV